MEDEERRKKEHWVGRGEKGGKEKDVLDEEERRKEEHWVGRGPRRERERKRRKKE